MDKTYDSAAIEAKHYARWEASGAFACGASGEARPYTIVIPPPNVTGSLHMGHALNNTLQDILIRFERMRGRDALWQPGTDHAGIATQMVVERQMAEKDLSRHDLGREKFIERVWAWKAESGDTITGQLRRLGASCDWGRERFTMDQGLSEAVRRVFVTLHEEGLIYRDHRLVNWDPRLHTAISDLEVEQREVKGSLWHFKYPLEGTENNYVIVATTRPETMLGDTAVAVHPDDDRYRDMIGKYCIQPSTGRRLPIIADESADPEQGSGAVKITPAHDFNDFEVGRRHDLEMISIFDENACLNDAVPERYRGFDRFEAREKIIAEMDGQDLLERVEDNPMTIPYADRSGVIIEPRLTDQWYVEAAKLAGAAVQAVERGGVRFVPQHWENTFFEWMRHIQPWCISRQIWWGHQIPAWYAPDGHIFVAMTEDEAQVQAEAHYGKAVELQRDPDVLDTWFSSALWPFSTLGWPEETDDLKRYYPTDVLVTGFDIIFFWVARMMMMGLHFMEEVPFRTVYIHALVRDQAGQKMSKSKGNVMDPLELIDLYGADALRFTLAALAAQGRDIKLGSGRIEGYRNFITKLWNAARYAKMNGCAPDEGFDPSACELTVNRWIVGALADTERDIASALENFRFNDAAHAIYQFTWHTFCDWYLEFTKPILGEGTAAAQAQAETRAATGWVLDQILHLLHPFAPFVTEELWENLAPEGSQRQGPLITAAWPSLGAGLAHAEARAEMDWVVRLISEIRAVRAEMNVPAAARITMNLRGASEQSARRLDTHREVIVRLARLSGAEISDDIPKDAAQGIVDEATVILPLGGVIDVEQERSRLVREIAKIEDEIGKIEKKLSNPQFVSRAPTEIIEENRGRRDEFATARAKLSEALDRLAAM